MVPNDSALVTVIIPFFNEENGLRSAIESVINQSYPALEIILVDDQSTDGSNAICDLYIEQYQYVSLYRSQQKGVSYARNLGLEKAKGDYIAFLDADDTLDHDMVKVLMAHFLSHPEADIVISKYNLYQNEVLKHKGLGWKSDGHNLSGEKAAKMMYSGGLVYTVWAKLFRKSIVQDILFPINLWFEDRPFILSSFLNSRRVDLIDEPLLNYNLRSGSITHRTVSIKRLLDLAAIFEIELGIVQDKLHLKGLKKAIISHHLNVWLENLCLISIDEKEIENFDEIKATYKNGISELEKQLNLNKIKLTWKQFGFIKLLKLYAIWPWFVYQKILCQVVFRTRFKKVKALKGII